jgi:hypothetical protein
MRPSFNIELSVHTMVKWSHPSVSQWRGIKLRRKLGKRQMIPKRIAHCRARQIHYNSNKDRIGFYINGDRDNLEYGKQGFHMCAFCGYLSVIEYFENEFTDEQLRRDDAMHDIMHDAAYTYLLSVDYKDFTGYCDEERLAERQRVEKACNSDVLSVRSFDPYYATVCQKPDSDEDALAQNEWHEKVERDVNAALADLEDHFGKVWNSRDWTMEDLEDAKRAQDAKDDALERGRTLDMMKAAEVAHMKTAAEEKRERVNARRRELRHLKKHLPVIVP